MKPINIIITCAVAMSACSHKDMENDAAGAFEATETIVSAESAGSILQINFQEGEEVKVGETAIEIDSTQLILKRNQLQAQIKAVLSRRPEINTQVAALEEELKHAEHELERTNTLLKANAATQKQSDDAEARVAVIRKQIRALMSSLSINKNSLNEEASPLYFQIEQLNETLSKCHVRHPFNGTILSRFAEKGELAAIGKPLYKLADLNEMILRAYISSDQFAHIKTGQKVKVLTDDGNGKFRSTEGTISWISNKAEFTPKTIQTKDERANLVYAIKVKVKNPGYLKIGMYGEIKF